MRSTFFVLLVSIGLNAAALAPSALFEKPLIVGASISSEWNKVQSPRKKAALNYTSLDQINVFAQPGRRGVDVLAAMGSDVLEGRSVVIGVDLFFWDTSNKLPNLSVGALWMLMNKIAIGNSSIILADVPALNPEYQPGVELMNQEIHAACAAQPSCVLLPLDRIFREAIAKGYVEHHGKRYTPQEILPDGLHLSEVGSEYVSERILDAVAAH